jgi:signal transduction histidine kinase
MLAVYFAYGLAFFALGGAALLERRQTSKLSLGRQLPWLAAFGFTHSLVEWSDMFLLTPVAPEIESALLTTRTILLPVSALLLIRFGAGLVGEMGPLPGWVPYARVVLLTPVTLIVAYALVVVLTEDQMVTGADVWSRYLLYFPGGLLVAFGFFRHWRRLPHTGLLGTHYSLLGASVAFTLYAIVAGLIVPETPYGVSPWLNYEMIQDVTGLPVQVWRMAVAVVVMVLVIRAMDVFGAEREQQLARLRAERERAQAAALAAQRDARHMAEAWIEALVQISRQIAMLEDLDQVLAQVVERARTLLKADGAALALWDETGDALMVKAFAGPNGLGREALRSDTIRSGMIFDSTRALQACLLAPEEGWHCSVLGARVQAGAIAPLVFEDQSVGVLWVVSHQTGRFSQGDLDRLGHLSDQAVIAIQHTLMAGRLQSLAVIEERARIAREMHDGLAQILGYLSLEIQTLDALVRQGDTDATLGELRQARARIAAAQDDVRENILSLRTTLAGDAGLLSALEEYVEEFGVQTGINAHVTSEIDVSRLSPLAETQLVRIVQEALANVRKHAAARQVQIRLVARDGCLGVTVTDDGVGFDHVPNGKHFGLQTMRERAESVGGGLTVNSVPSQGTQVTFWLPLAQP